MSIRMLYLCEKPDQAMKVAKELGPVARKDGWVECRDGAVVTWARGHLYQPMMPEDYSEELKRWSWDTLPIIPRQFRFKVRDESSKKMVRVINALLEQAQEVVVATDPDREGELIAYEILTEKKYKGPIRRLNLKDLTSAAIRSALANLEPGEKWYPRYQAALARTCADWVVGMNLSRAATLKLRRGGGGKPLSVGRVQTPTLALMVHQERRIQAFKPQDYFELVADVTTASGKTVRMAFRPPEARRILDPNQIEQIRQRAAGARGPISVVHEEKAKAPPPLLDLNALQQEANSRFGWASQKTLDVAQALYEGKNGASQPLLTYPRTDCQVLPEEHIGRIQQQIANLTSLPSFSHLAPKLAKPQVRSSVYDDTRVTAHTAIVPTLERANINALSGDERKIYELVCRFYLAAHLEDFRYSATRMQMDANGVPLATGGTTPIYPGWRDAFNAFEAAEEEAQEEGEEDAGILPDIADGEPGAVSKIETQKKKTKAPERFTEKKLLQAMKNIASFVDDAAAKKRLKQTSGIGTSATRGNIIETLKQREFIRVEKRKLIPTDTGMGLIAALELAAPDYADPVVTARWEDGLELIEQNGLTVDQFVKLIIDKMKADVEKLRTRTDLGVIGDEGDGPRMSREARDEILKTGIEIHVPYGKNEEAKKLGCVWNAEKSCWFAPADVDRAKLIAMNWLNVDGSRPLPAKNPNAGGMPREEIIAKGFAVAVPYGKNEEAKAFGGIFDGTSKTWFMPPTQDKQKFIDMGWLQADGSLPEKKGGGNGSGASAGPATGAPVGMTGGRPAGGQATARVGGGSGGTRLEAPFDRRNDVKALGARWNGEEKAWYAPPGADLEPFRKAGFLSAA